MCQVCMEVAGLAGVILTILNAVGIGFFWKKIKTAFKSKRCKEPKCACECHKPDEKGEAK